MTNAREFAHHLATLLRREHESMADFLVALAEFDRRELWREIGHTSLFYFLRRELGLSAGAAQYRKTAAELLQRFPQIEAPLRDGRLCLSSVAELGKVLTPENQEVVLPRFFGLSSREATLVAVSIRPVENPPRREIVTPLWRSPVVETETPAAVAGAAVAGAAVANAATDTASAAIASSASFVAASAMPGRVGAAPLVRAPELPLTPDAAREGSVARAPPHPVKPVVVEPLDATWSRLHITVSREFLAKLEAAKDALSHSHPGASADAVLEACMDLLIAERAKRKAALVARPRKNPRPSQGRKVPAHVRRAVWKRAGGRCEWTFESGERCNSTRQLEFDHAEVPWARGGRATVQNVKLHCKPHNLLGARRVFGGEWMDRFAKKRPATASGREMSRSALVERSDSAEKSGSRSRRGPPS